MSGKPAYTEYHPRWYRPHVSTYWWLHRRSYLLFILRAGVYDLLSRRAGKSTWYVSVDVPLDRTRLWVPPDTREELVFPPEGGRQVHRARK